MFCGPEIVDDCRKHRQSRVHKTYCFPEVSVNKYFIIYQDKANFIRKYMKYFINFLKNVKFNSVHNVIRKTFAVFGCLKIACSRDGARDFFYSPVNNALSPSGADARETVQFSQSHVIRSPPMKHVKRRTLTIGI